jgi:hypothetical protein
MELSQKGDREEAESKKRLFSAFAPIAIGLRDRFQFVPSVNRPLAVAPETSWRPSGRKVAAA